MNAVITGCNRGIGKAILEKFVKSKINVFAIIRKPYDGFEKWAKDLAALNGAEINFFYADFAQENSVVEVAKKILNLDLAIDVLVNNVGVLGNASSFLMTKIEDIKLQFDINFFNSLSLTKELCENMKKNNKGAIVNVASISGIDGYGVQLGYAASKAAIIGATRCLARELAAYNIRCNAVAPGLIDTDMSSSMTEDQMSEVTNRVWFKKLGGGGGCRKRCLFSLNGRERLHNWTSDKNRWWNVSQEMIYA